MGLYIDFFLKKRITTIGLIALLMNMASCGFQKPLTNSYFENGEKVGVIYMIDSIGIYKDGPQGSLDMALTPANSFEEPLRSIDQRLAPGDDIKNMFRNLFLNKGKSLIELDISLSTDQLLKLEVVDTKGKYYHSKDLRFLKEQGIDELMIVRTSYGVVLSDDGSVQNAEKGNCQISYEIVDLNDNAILFSDHTASTEKIKNGRKTPLDYDNLFDAIKGAIEKTIEIQKSKLYR